MKLILITTPQVFEGETNIINQMFDIGLEILHLRKPEITLEEMDNFVSQIDEKYRNRVVLHGCYELIDKYDLKGAHIGANRQINVEEYHKHLSFSCHSLQEVEVQKTKCDYVFLSPIFDSISKQGYASSFTEDELLNAKNFGIIDNRVIALGGIMPSKVNFVNKMGFGGIAVLGDVWQNPNPVKRLQDYLSVL